MHPAVWYNAIRAAHRLFPGPPRLRCETRWEPQSGAPRPGPQRNERKALTLFGDLAGPAAGVPAGAMAHFKTPRTGCNVVHRIELPTGGSRQRSKRRALRRGRDSGVVVERIVERVVEPKTPATERTPVSVVPTVQSVEPAPRPLSLTDSHARQQIQLLERRLAKMARLLEDREEEVLSRSATDSDQGVPSIYRKVQGLNGRGQEVKQKKALMSKIFEANLDLRKRINTAS